MSLKIKGWRKIITWLFWSVLAILLLIFIVRVLIFEHNYIKEKEGSERDIAKIVSTSEDLVEVEPTDTEVKEYTVPDDHPRYLTIEKLNVNKARVLPMGVNAKGELDTPNNIFDVGWYNASSRPGFGGTLVIDGHNGGPTKFGVFKYLPTLVEGDIIVVERGDGTTFKYSVVENKEVLLKDADAYMSTAMRSPKEGRESITLISCAGEWSQQQGTYLSRQFTRALLEE